MIKSSQQLLRHVIAQAKASDIYIYQVKLLEEHENQQFSMRGHENKLDIFFEGCSTV